MRESDFTADSLGRLVPADILGGQYWPAFVPDPLMPAIAWRDQTVALLSKADRALSRLDGRAADLPNPHLMVGFVTGREAVASSSIGRHYIKHCRAVPISHGRDNQRPG